MVMVIILWKIYKNTIAASIENTCRKTEEKIFKKIKHSRSFFYIFISTLLIVEQEILYMYTICDPTDSKTLTNF